MQPAEALPQVTTGSSLVAKTTAGDLYGFSVTEGGTAGFVALVDANAVPSAGGAIAPLECVAVAANTTFRTRQVIGDRFNNGLVLLSTSSCTTYTAVTPTLMEVLVR